MIDMTDQPFFWGGGITRTLIFGLNTLPSGCDAFCTRQQYTYITFFVITKTLDFDLSSSSQMPTYHFHVIRMYRGGMCDHGRWP